MSDLIMSQSILRNASLLTILLTASINVQAANAPIVKDGDIDAGARIMKIHCPSGSQTTVRLYFQEYKQHSPGQTCIYQEDGSDICRNNWDLDEAAVDACNQ